MFYCGCNAECKTLFKIKHKNKQGVYKIPLVYKHYYFAPMLVAGFNITHALPVA